jgi:flagellar FliL protein
MPRRATEKNAMLPSHWVKIGLMLLAFVLATPHLPAGLASSESGHGGDAKKSEKKGDKKDAGKPENGAIVIGPLTVNILSNKGYRFLRLALRVECEDNAAAERITLPDDRQDLVFTLSSKLAEDLLTNAGKMALRKELLDLFSKYAGQGKVKNIYFQEFVFQ